MENIHEYIIKTALLIITLCISENAKYSSDAKVVQGEIWTHENWKFLTSFASRIIMENSSTTFDMMKRTKYKT